MALIRNVPARWGMHILITVLFPLAAVTLLLLLGAWSPPPPREVGAPPAGRSGLVVVEEVLEQVRGAGRPAQ